MGPIHPVVRHLIVCDEILHDPENPRRVTLVNLIHAIGSVEQPPFPMRHPEFCVFAQLSACRGTGEFRIEVVQADTGTVVRRTRLGATRSATIPWKCSGCPFAFRIAHFLKQGFTGFSSGTMTI